MPRVRRQIVGDKSVAGCVACKEIHEPAVDYRAVGIETFVSDVNTRRDLFHRHVHDPIGDRRGGDAGRHGAEEVAHGAFELVRPVERCGQSVLMAAGKRAHDRRELTQHRRRAGKMVAFVHYHGVKGVSEPAEVLRRERLHGRKCHARAYIHLPGGYRTEKRGIHIHSRALHALL